MRRSPSRVSATCLLAGMAALQPAHALDEHTVLRPDGTHAFTVRFISPEDGPMLYGPSPEPFASTWTLNDDQKGKILSAMQYWGEVLRPVSGAGPAVVNIGTVEDANAYGISPYTPGMDPTPSQLLAQLTGIEPGPLLFDSHAQFVMGKMGWDTQPWAPSHVARTGAADLSAIALHELAHGLGVSATMEARGEDTRQTFGPVLNTWDVLLRDDQGRPAQPNQAVLCRFCEGPDDPDAFDAREDRAILVGPHINEVLDGAMPGVPVTNLYHPPQGDPVDDLSMSHIELERSLMSHQSYRNYTTFMEAELAVLQDLGHHIDRRNHFGRSVYHSGRTVLNDHGYFQRHADGTAYLPGTYNTSLLGLGLHVYGSDNTIVQQADLLTRGAGAAGARIDGNNNHLVIAPGVRVHANGEHGRALLFAHGRDHQLTVRGEVQALGPDGIGISADFGHNTMGDDGEYRGSYIRTANGVAIPLLPSLDGPLLSRIDLTGRVAGRAAAIHLSDNALVERIHVMQGAQLDGNIVSDYRERDAQGALRLTQLSFGQRADDAGQAMHDADPGFRWRYDGQILGDNLALQAHGGHTALYGSHRVHSVQVMPGATLSGDSRYVLQPGQVFANDGVLSPGNSFGHIGIDGDYRQGTHGTLRLDVDGQGRHDTLMVSGQAQLDGQLAITPLPGWYAPGWQVAQHSLLQADHIIGGFTRETIELASPTLGFAFQRTADGSRRLTAQRAADAYRRYGRHANDQRVGGALDRIVNHARADMQPLYQALDFSAADGSDIWPVLSQLSGGAYSALMSASFAQDRQVADVAATPRGPMLPGAGWQAYAAPYALDARQRARHDQQAYEQRAHGLVIGGHTQRDAWTVGVYGAIGEQRLKFPGLPDTRARATVFHLGAYARHAANDRAGPHYAAQAQWGVARSRLDRTVQWPGQTVRHQGRWTGHSASVSADAGYRWALSPTTSIGPVAGLHYRYWRRPGLLETGGGATRLRLATQQESALHASLGVVVDAAWPLKAGGQAGARLSMAWERDLLGGHQTQRAHFADYAQDGFATRHGLARGNTLHLQAGLHYQPRASLRIELGASTRMRSGYRDVAGEVSAHWRF